MRWLSPVGNKRQGSSLSNDELTMNGGQPNSCFTENFKFQLFAGISLLINKQILTKKFILGLFIGIWGVLPSINKDNI